MEAHRRYGASRRNFELRRDFYLTYLEDVTPWEVNAHHIPNDRQFYDLRERGADVRREEIVLYYGDKIFMTCVISMDLVTTDTETVAALAAFHHWRDGECIPDRHQAWDMFTCLDEIRFCKSLDGREWVRTATFQPIVDVRQVVAYFRQEFERVKVHERDQTDHPTTQV